MAVSAAIEAALLNVCEDGAALVQAILVGARQPLAAAADFHSL